MSSGTVMIPSSECNTERSIPKCNPKTVCKTSRKASSKSDIKSEYQTAFRRYAVEKPRKLIKIRHKGKDHRTEMDCQTVYRQDFVKHEIANRKEKKSLKYTKPRGQVDRLTTYMHDYSEKLAQRAKSHRPQCTAPPKSAKFSGESIYKTEYQAYDENTAKTCRPETKKPKSIQSKSPKFTATSTVHEDFKSHPPTERVKSQKPESTMRVANEKVQNASTYSEDFTRKESSVVEPVKPNSGPSILKHNTTGRTSPEDHAIVTTFMADFRPHFDVKRVACCRPRESDYSSDMPFDGQTTQSVAYQSWPVKKPETPKWAQKPAYVRPGAQRVLETTYKGDYRIPDRSQMRSPFQPDLGREDIIKHDRGDVGTNFRDKTIYQSNYLQYKYNPPPKSFKKTAEYEPPKETICCESTHRTHYKGEKTDRAHICRHTSEHRGLNNDRNMYFNTTYNDTYKSKYRPKSCPVCEPNFKVSYAVPKSPQPN